MKHFLPLLLDAAMRITVYNHADVPQPVLLEAAEHVRQIFSSPGIETRLESGDTQAPEGFLLSYGKAGAAPCRARKDIAVRITFAAAAQRASILGMSNPQAERGLNVVLYYDRVRRTASRRVRPESMLLAYAMAHEIGHVLLRSEAHSRSGIMAADWGDAEYHWMARGVFSFSRGQARAMRSALTGASCPG